MAHYMTENGQITIFLILRIASNPINNSRFFFPTWIIPNELTYAFNGFFVYLGNTCKVKNIFFTFLTQGRIFLKTLVALLICTLTPPRVLSSFSRSFFF